ncbi:MAG: FeoB-associated Cys-rich membrane protein [Oscillospiraceae bacterium]|jgi:hypothetical protein
MNWQSWVLLAAVAAIVVLIVINTLRKAHRGEPPCSCGGNCSECAYYARERKEAEKWKKASQN